MLLALGSLGAGCSGINTGTSVSPASFFLPGLMRYEVCTNAPTAFPISTQIASVK